MFMFFDFQCEQDHVTEAFVSSDTKEHPCGVCAKQARRIVSPVRAKLDAISGDFPGATLKWAKNRERQIKHERKTNSEG